MFQKGELGTSDLKAVFILFESFDFMGASPNPSEGGGKNLRTKAFFDLAERLCNMLIKD
jgi:hypothetical protein